MIYMPFELCLLIAGFGTSPGQQKADIFWSTFSGFSHTFYYCYSWCTWVHDILLQTYMVTVTAGDPSGSGKDWVIILWPSRTHPMDTSCHKVIRQQPQAPWPLVLLPLASCIFNVSPLAKRYHARVSVVHCQILILLQGCEQKDICFTHNTFCQRALSHKSLTNSAAVVGAINPRALGGQCRLCACLKQQMRHRQLRWVPLVVPVSLCQTCHLHHCIAVCGMQAGDQDPDA